MINEELRKREKIETAFSVRGSATADFNSEVRRKFQE